MTGELISTGITFGAGRIAINNSFSGTAILNNLSLDSGGNFSGGTGGGKIFSGGTDLYNIFQTTADGNDITRIQPGSNIVTGGTGNLPTVSIISSPSLNGLTLSGTGQFAGATATSFSATTLSGGTIISGGTNLYSIFGNDVTRVRPGTNIITGGTANVPIVSTSPTPIFSSLTVSGATLTNSISATTMSAGTIYSGSTPLSIIVSNIIANGLWSASTAPNSIIQSNNKGNTSTSYDSVIIGSGCTADGNSSNHAFNYVLGGIRNIFTIAGGFIPPTGCNVLVGGKYNEIRSTFATSENTVLLGGEANLVSTTNGAMIGGSGNTLQINDFGISLGGEGNTISIDKSVMIGGDYNLLSSFSALQNLTMISSSGISLLETAYSGIQDHTTIMQRTHIDEYVDLKPQSTLPAPLKGRLFFSGGTLNRLMVNTNGTAGGWITV